MANAIRNDNIPTHQTPKERKVDTRPNDARQDSGVGRNTTDNETTVDLQRAQQRLMQEIDAAREPSVTTLEEARARVREVLELINGDPQAALKAHAAVNANRFTAAATQPSA